MRLKNLTITVSLVIISALDAWGGTPATMRLDFFHTGNATQELFSVDRVVMEPVPWPGNPNRPIDATNRGKYFFEVRDLSSKRVLYSRGFSSIYGEWVTTDEAKTANRTFHESLRFPAPEAPVQIVVKKRNPQNTFREIWTTNIDPKDKNLDTSKPPFSGRVLEIEKNGDSAFKVDLLFLGEGYTAAEQDKCEKDVRRLTAGVFTFSPFKERRQDFNIWAICAPSPDSGVSHPAFGIHRNTLFGSQFDVFGEERYALSFDNRAIRSLQPISYILRCPQRYHLTVILLTTVWDRSECPARPRIQCGGLRAAATTVRFVPAPSAIALRAISSIPWS